MSIISGDGAFRITYGVGRNHLLLLLLLSHLRCYDVVLVLMDRQRQGDLSPRYGLSRAGR